MASLSLYCSIRPSKIDISLASLTTGARDKSPPKKILCFLKHAPSEHFQYISILSPQRLTHYIHHQKHLFSREQIESLVAYLLECEDIPESPSSKFSVAPKGKISVVPKDSAGPGCLASIGWILVLLVAIILLGNILRAP